MIPHEPTENGPTRRTTLRAFTALLMAQNDKDKECSDTPAECVDAAKNIVLAMRNGSCKGKDRGL
jgi:hypothetical protein